MHVNKSVSDSPLRVAVTMSELKPITVYVHSAGPNPFKVIIVLEELSVPYTKIVVDDPKEDWFVAINPNGRVPAIKDPNSNIVLWESGAIMEYLVETYDVDKRLCGASPASKWEIKQYLHFQMSGQGPYYGQAMWFHKCPQDIPIAKERYVNEIIRVISVLDNILEGKKYLVDDKLSVLTLVDKSTSEANGRIEQYVRRHSICAMESSC
jgi:glutathione S-transferase